MAQQKITRSQYEDLKKSYLTKNRTLHSLYIEMNEKTPVDRRLFFALINKIRQEEGLSEYYKTKQKKRNNCIENFSLYNFLFI